MGGVAGTLFPLIAIRPAPEPKKHQDEKDAAANGATDDRPRGIRAPVIVRRGSRIRSGRIGEGRGDVLSASRTDTINYGRIAYAEGVVNVVLHLLQAGTYMKRSSSQTLGGDELETVILMVWSPFWRSSFLNKEIGTSSLAA